MIKIYGLAILITEKILSVLIKFIGKNSPKQIHTYLIRTLTSLVSKTLKKVGLNHPLTVYPDGKLYIIESGIMLNCSGTNRYLKWRNDFANEGFGMDDQIKRFGIIPRIIFDIGANFGEISLYFSKYYPNCKIVAVEASPENFDILKDNINVQLFTTKNITPVHKALSGKKGIVRITSGLGSENSIVVDKTFKGSKKASEFVDVESTTLLNICDELNLYEIDFLKIDIEGAEPLLSESLSQLLPNVKLMLIELSYKNTEDAYISLLKIIFSHNFLCFKQNESIEKSMTFDKAVQNYRDSLASGKSGVNYYFVNKRACPKT